MPRLLDKKNIDMLTSEGVYTEAELHSRYEIMLENYCKTVSIEALTMADMAKKEILPAVEAYAADTARAAAAKRGLDPDCACTYERGLVRRLSTLCDVIAANTEALEDSMLHLHDAGRRHRQRAAAIRDDVLPRMRELRAAADEAESITSAKYWPYPTYSELLYGVG